MQTEQQSCSVELGVQSDNLSLCQEYLGTWDNPNIQSWGPQNWGTGCTGMPFWYSFILLQVDKP
jgi:hypothetical protein